MRNFWALTRTVAAAVLLYLGGSCRVAFAAVPRVAPVVRTVYPHDPNAFTQGLVFFEGRLFESTGLRGRSTLRSVALSTGEVERSLELPSSEFGEGLARVWERLVQLTWTEGKAHVYRTDTFERLKTFDYTGEGWGLCFDDQRLVMSDGSASLFFRDPNSFELQGSVTVTRDGYPVRRLNELECVKGFVYANVWQSQEIVKIDPRSGQVVATIAVSGLLSPAEAQHADVLNGIAYQPDSGHFFITGKLWPKLYEVEFPDQAAPDYTPPAQPPALPKTASPPAPADLRAAPLPAPPRTTTNCHCSVPRMSGSARSAALLLVVGLCWVRRRQRKNRLGQQALRRTRTSPTARISAEPTPADPRC